MSECGTCARYLALPMLDAMSPSLGASARDAKPPCRMLVNYVPNGIIMKDWLPTTEGREFELQRILQPMAQYRERILLINGLAQHYGIGLADGPGDHARAAFTYLSGVHAKKTGGADIEAGISMDQVAARQIGKQTRIPSLELACEDGRMVGVCDSGYSCVYSNNISWRSSTTPSAPEVNPRAVFENLFGLGDEDPVARAATRRQDASILDWVLGETRTLETRLGPSDRNKMDEYMTAVREIELRINNSERRNQEIKPTMEKPEATPVELSEHLKLMYDLLLVAFQTDSTRIATLMVGREGSLRTYPEIGIPDCHHPLTHHKGQADLIEKVYQINRHHMELFSGFVAKLAASSDGDGTLLDHTMILYGGGLADGNRHQHDHLPAMLVGGACGTLKTGRYLQLQKTTAINNLYVSMLNRMGIPIATLGDSSGPLNELSELA
jgi:Protein of unknown function (DUF1552)